MGSGWEKLFFYGIEVILYVMDNGYVFFVKKVFSRAEGKRKKKRGRRFSLSFQKKKKKNQYP